MNMLRSAFVIARRDFTATVFSRAFLLFLLGPLFPVLMAAIFGTIGGAALSQAERPVVAVVSSEAEYRAWLRRGSGSTTRRMPAMSAPPCPAPPDATPIGRGFWRRSRAGMRCSMAARQPR